MYLTQYTEQMHVAGSFACEEGEEGEEEELFFLCPPEFGYHVFIRYKCCFFEDVQG